ncbi:MULTISPECIES: precorrin-6A/cobalt-precorrin-6A reductase [Caproicibacterium]|uniref:Precorrin-6A/cobalt-precorrin-6A reductase n=1 Tax=Caproicibacterium argilliputei TaxID=3030016 RepID=A0AA97H1L1_9FIRM|nr:precorrin-6A/cobalt-precorrin-6A reductase [Caproicibacterium argilliputei]WOC32548.1 precorrin-6A/cobalt-precorrin-6A reductase [Caproicibacterium argilliputei]
MKQKLLLFADNAEGRHLAEVLCALPLEVTACVAAGCGGFSEPHGVRLRPKLTDGPEICRYLRREHFGWVIDATHPCTVKVTQTIRAAARSSGTPYLRLLRTKTAKHRICYVASVAEAAARLSNTTANILLSVCSDDIRCFCDVPRAQLYVSVPHTFPALQACETAQILPSRIFAAQEPFCRKDGPDLLRQLQIGWLVINGNQQDENFEAKVTAAEEAGVNVLVVGKSVEETGYPYGEILELLASELGES